MVAISSGAASGSRAGGEHRAAGRIGADAERPAAAQRIEPEHRELGLSEQLEQIGARTLEPDLDHRIGHRHDLVDHGEEGRERVAAARRDRAAQHSRRLLGGDRRAVGPFGFAQAEDIAAAVVDHDPALGKPGLDLAGCVEAHQPLRGRVHHQPARWVEMAGAGIARRRARADRADRERRVRRLAAAPRRRERSREGEREGGELHLCFR